ncbi:MAG: ROK family protein [Candidatus Azobacteroides sp.]|nr:ROK family protein [Candidatus Azobacteroides sp.]
MRDYAVGIDIGGGSATIGIVDKNGEIIVSNRENPVRTHQHKNVKDFILALCNNIEDLIEEKKEILTLNKIEGIGIGAPTASYRSGTIEKNPNLPWSDEKIEIVKMMEEKINLPTSLDNDANVAALGEWKYGKGKGVANFIMITLGTGLGSGIIAEGKLIRGHNGLAGELGHIIVRRNGGRRCGCGRYGCAETYVSAKGLARTAIEFLEVSKKDNPSNLKQIYDARKKKGLLALQQEGYKEDLLICSKDVAEYAEKGDLLAHEIFEYTGKVLGEAMADYIAFSDPEMIVLFGGLVKSGDLLLNPVRKYMNQSLLNIYQGKTRIEISALNDHADAAVLGASALVWEGK